MPGYAPTSARPSSMPTSANLPQPRDVALPDFTSNTYVPFGFTITGSINILANMKAAWTPKETKFVLRGGYVHILCTNQCSGLNGMLCFFDESDTKPLLPITAYGSTTSVGWINDITPWPFDLGKGYKSQAKNNRLLIGGTQAIGSGILYCAGLLWGVQEL